MQLLLESQWDILVDTEKTILKLTWKGKWNTVVKQLWKRGIKWKEIFYLISILKWLQYSGLCGIGEQIDEWNRTRNPQTALRKYGHSFFAKVQKEFNGRMTVF